jgi:aspartyl-tRNA(Asn)/glutamyl-tRNA(Gln) amidotransferase subunit A
MIDLSTLTIAAARRSLDAKQYSAVQLAQAYLDAIHEKDGELHAYLEVFSDVQAQAERADLLIAEGRSQPLTGIPLAIKDNILIKGRRAGAASKILEGYIAPYSATVIEKLEAMGAVFLGRTNMDEFAMGGSTERTALP